MKLESLQAVLSAAVVIFSATPAEGSLAHRHMHHLDQRHSLLHAHGASKIPGSSAIAKRGGNCKFPTDDPNLVAITPGNMNAGWAMSPDQECKPGNYCPIACKPGMMMAQWDPKSKYTYPLSMNGGLYCDKDGNVHKPFPDKPYCVEGTGAVKAVNKCNREMSWCQTVLPGNEAMLIPTIVQSIATLAVPDPSYWQGTSAHFYINPPGIPQSGCKWGTSSQAIGNWSPYVAGANTDSNGQTFVKIGYNPVWQSSSLGSTPPDFGVRIECPNGGCNGLPCEIKPGSKVQSNEAAVGAGGSSFCVVTVSKGSTAHIVAFDGSGGSGGSDNDDDKDKPSSPPPLPKTSKAAPPPTTAAPSTESSPSPTPKPPKANQAAEKDTTTTEESSEESSTTPSETPSVHPGIFHENDNATTTMAITGSPSKTSAADSASPPKTTSKNEAGRQQGSGAMAGLVVAFVAAACFF